MHFSASTVLLRLFAVGHVISMPTADPVMALIERDDPDCGDADTPDGLTKRAQCKVPVQCGPTGNQAAYPSNYINSAVKQAKMYRSKGTVNGSYPKAYGANDTPVLKALPAECKPTPGLTLYEYPIVEGHLFDGNDANAGPDRVLISESNGVRSYCLTMTHRGATDNSFVVCPATTS